MGIFDLFRGRNFCKLGSKSRKFLLAKISSLKVHFFFKKKHAKACKPGRVVRGIECIDRYMELSNPWRKNESQLLLSYIRPYEKVSTSTISRWVVDVLKQSGIDTEMYKAHSTRSASTSKVKRKLNIFRLSISDILKRRHWSGESTFQKFCNKELIIIIP